MFVYSISIVFLIILVASLSPINDRLYKEKIRQNSFRENYPKEVSRIEYVKFKKDINKIKTLKKIIILFIILSVIIVIIKLVLDLI